jgi:SP family facilitated glucose transporter-like MFS transporter 1
MPPPCVDSLQPIISKRTGRKTTLLLTNVFVFISCGLMAFSTSWVMMACGRICIGIVAGIATGVVPIYFSEISPTRVRGAVGTAHQLGITLGILISQVLSTPSLNLLGTETRWPFLFIVPAACALLEMVLLPWCPESPSYLYKTKGEAAAREALKKLQTEEGGEIMSDRIVDRYIRNIAAEAEQEDTEEAGAADSGKAGGADSARMSLAQLFSSVKLRKQLCVGVVIQLSMQFSGIDAVFYYSTEVFQRAGVTNAPLATTILGVINVLMTIGAVRVMDSMGRRTLLVG